MDKLYWYTVLHVYSQSPGLLAFHKTIHSWIVTNCNVTNQGFTLVIWLSDARKRAILLVRYQKLQFHCQTLETLQFGCQTLKNLQFGCQKLENLQFRCQTLKNLQFSFTELNIIPGRSRFLQNYCSALLSIHTLPENCACCSQSESMMFKEEGQVQIRWKDARFSMCNRAQSLAILFKWHVQFVSH